MTTTHSPAECAICPPGACPGGACVGNLEEAPKRAARLQAQIAEAADYLETLAAHIGRYTTREALAAHLEASHAFHADIASADSLLAIHTARHAGDVEAAREALHDAQEEAATDPGGPDCAHDGKPCSPVVGDCLCPCYDCHNRRLDHDCPKQAFLDDPITESYGVGGDFVGSIACAVCDAEAQGPAETEAEFWARVPGGAPASYRY